MNSGDQEDVHRCWTLLLFAHRYCCRETAAQHLLRAESDQLYRVGCTQTQMFQTQGCLVFLPPSTAAQYTSDLLEANIVRAYMQKLL